MSSHNPIISVIIPCYNEEEVLLACHSRLIEVFEGYDNHEYELIYVNDGSSDRTEELLRYLHDSYPQTRVVMLSRNFGHQAAVTAGLTAASGQCAVIIDADEAENIIFLKRSMRPGFAGIDNELLYDPKTTLLFGDAKDSLQKLVAAVADA